MVFQGREIIFLFAHFDSNIDDRRRQGTAKLPLKHSCKLEMDVLLPENEQQFWKHIATESIWDGLPSSSPVKHLESSEL